MAGRYEELVRRVRQSVLAGPGETAPALRQAVEARVTARSLGGEATDEVPAELHRLVRKIAERAYEVTDEDVESLRRAGYSEDAIFELTVSAALGAGAARLRRGLDALKGGE